MSKAERLLTAREVGEMLSMSTEPVLRRWRAGEIPGFRIASNVLRFDPADIEAWLCGCRTQRAKEPAETERGGG